MVSVVKRERDESSPSEFNSDGTQVVDSSERLGKRSRRAASAKAAAKISAVISFEENEEEEEQEQKKDVYESPSASSASSVASVESNGDEEVIPARKPATAGHNNRATLFRKSEVKVTTGGNSSSIGKLSSVSDLKSLAIPDGVNAMDLPTNWRDFVKTELAACGVGVDEKYESQLAAYDSSDDEAGDRPRREPVRKRLAIVEAAKHYNVPQSYARKLILIVDANLANVGLEVGCAKRNRYSDPWTSADDNLLLIFMRNKMIEGKYDGRARLPAGFWGELKLSTFPDRTESALYQRWKEIQCSADGQVQKPPNWTSAEDERLAKAVKKERACKGKIRPGFWPNLLASEFSDRSLGAVKKRLVIIEKKIGRIGSRRAVHFSRVDDDEILRAVANELETSQTGRVRNKFWSRLQKDRFRDKTPQDIALRYRKVIHEKKYGRADGRRFTGEEDAKLISLLVANGVGNGGFGKAPKWVWGDVQKDFPGRTPRQLHDRWSWKKKQLRKAKVMVPKAATPDPLKITALSPYQALKTKYPPGTSIIYCPSSSDSAGTARPGRVMKVEMRTSTHESDNGVDSLYLHTIFDDDNGNRYERVPERFLEKRG